jgi:hypothetical protein
MINYFANIPFIVKYFYICKQSNNKSFAEAEKQNRVGSTLNQIITMKNLRKISKKQLKSIEGGAAACPPPATTCGEWCSWTAQQRLRCPNMVMDPDPCGC